MTTERPAPPRRPFALFLPLLVAAVGFSIGGATATVAQGVVWGAIAGAALVIAFRMARLELGMIDQAALVAGAVASAVLSTLVLPDVPERAVVSLALRFGTAWIPMGIAAAVTVHRSGARTTKTVNAAIAWPVAGALALAGSLAFGALVPLRWLGPVDEPSYGGAIFAVIGFVVALLGVAVTFSILSGMPSLMAGAYALFFTAFAGAQVGFTILGLIRDMGNIVNIPNLLPPDFDWAMGEEARGRWGFIWKFALTWAIVAVAGLLYARLRHVSRVTRLAGSWVLIAIAAVILGWWLPQWEFGPNTVGDPLIETFRIAIIAAVAGCGVAMPIAFMASKITSPNPLTYLANKGFMNFIRTIPDLFWAMIFVAALGIGPFGGAIALFFFSLAIMAKLLSETVDAVDPGPLEAAKATGSRHFPAVRASVLPQVLPNYVAYGLYIFEINIRASAVIGLVGAGGIGRILEAQRVFYRFDRVLAIVIVIFVIVFMIEQMSVALRRRLV